MYVLFFEVLVVERRIVAGGAVAVRVAQAVEGRAEDATSPAALLGVEPSLGAERAVDRQFDPAGMNEMASRPTHGAKSGFGERHAAAAPVQVHDLALDESQRLER